LVSAFTVSSVLCWSVASSVGPVCWSFTSGQPMRCWLSGAQSSVEYVEKPGSASFTRVRKSG